MQKVCAWGRARCSGLTLLAMTTMMAAGCGGGGSGSASPASVNSPAGANSAPTISGAPRGEAQVGAAYSVTPEARDADGDTLAFSIQNKPDWAVFNTTTGALTGSPGAQHVGVNRDVTISVSDGRTSVSMAPFSITVSTATSVPEGASVALSWDVPTTTVDGATLSDLAGYRIHYGLKANALTEAVEVPSAGLNNYVVQGLKKGKYYFAVRAITASGGQSPTSNLVSKVIR